MEKQLTVGSLFAGIGGFDLGFQRAGYKIQWQVEIDPFCRKVLAKHFPEAERYEDVRAVGKSNLVPVDVLCGGFPCQDISVAGKGAGIEEGTRSGLWIEFARIIGEIRPRYVVVENVRALLSRGMFRVLGDLSALGYDSEWRTLRASSFGLLGKRERVWIVAYPHSDGLQRIKQWVPENTYRGDFDAETLPPFSLQDPRIKNLLPAPHVIGKKDGVPDRVDRTRACGNSVVPQIPEWIANQILKYEGLYE